MIQQISDAELEIMKIVWGNPEKVTLFSYIMDGLAARGKPCQKNTLIVLLSRLMNKGFLSARKIMNICSWSAFFCISESFSP